MPLDIKKLEQLEEEAQSRLDPASDDYDGMVQSLSRISNLIDTHYKGQRKVDDTGKLTADATTRQPARVGEGESDYFFEPNVREVQAFFKRNPDALDRLRDSKGQPLRPWAEGVAQEEIRSPMFDPQTQAVTGYNVQPAKTHLDQLTEEQEPYKVAAEEMWRLASEGATQKGRGLKRYRDIKLDRGEWKDVIAGGVTKGYDRIIKPAALGAADSLSAGLASPAYDKLLAYGQSRQANMTPVEKESARSMGFDPEDTQGMSSSEDIQNRSPSAYVAGNITGYGMGFNPANMAQRFIQEGLEEVAKNAAKQAGAAGVNTVNRAAAAGVAGGAVNSAESAIGDVGRSVIEGTPLDVGRTARNAGTAGLVGTAAGFGFDLVGQGIGAGRDAYTDLGRNAPLRTMENAGAEASIPYGIKPTQEWEQARAQQKQDRMDPTLAPYTIAGKMSENLAPELERSVKNRALGEQARISAQQEEYFNHPAYRDRTVSAAPAVQGLIDMATRGIARAPIDGSMMPMNPRAVDEIGGILRNYSQHGPPIPRAQAPAIANTTGGVVVDGELANRLYGLNPDDPGSFKPGTDAVVRPLKINAQKLTELEGRIDNELKFAKTPGGVDEPVWRQFNATVKKMRDEFPLYRDADGKLVEPPPPEPEPFAPADDMPRPEEGRYLAPPLEVRGPHPRKPEGLMGVGGDVPIPENPFDARLPTTRESIRPQPIVNPGGEYSQPNYMGPEASPGIGPNYQPPDDPRRLGPAMQGQRMVNPGGEYSQPGMVTQPAIPGPGPRRDTSQLSGASPDALRPQPTVDVTGGDYSPPQRVLPDEPPAVDTPRMPMGMPKEPWQLDADEYTALAELPPGGNPLAPSKVSEESLQAMSLKERAPDSSTRERTDRIAPIGDANDLKKGPEALIVPRKHLPAQLERLGITPTKSADEVAKMSREGDELWAQRMGLSSVDEYHEYLEAFHARKVKSPEDFKRQRAANQGPPMERSDELAAADMDEGMYTREYGKTPPIEAPELTPNRGESLAAFEARGGKTGFKLPPEVQAKVDDGTLTTEARQKAINRKTEAKPSRSPLERQLDAQLDAPDAPPVPKTEIEEAGARQTADREQVAKNQKDYVEKLFAPGREARAAQVEKVRSLGEHPEVIEEAMEAVKKADERLGPIDQAEKRRMVIGIIEKKLGRKIDAEDLIRFGLIGAGLVEMSALEDDKGSAVGAGILSLGLGRGKGKQGPATAPKGPSKPTKPTQPEATLEDGTVVRGFSAMRNEQHNEQEAIERAMKRIGVGGDITMENRIRTYGQLDDRGKIDQALLDEALRVNKGPELRNAAGANAYEELKDRRVALGNEGFFKGLLDAIGFRLYAGSEYFAGRHQRYTPPGKDGMYRNPFVKDPETTLGKMQRSLVEDPARRLLSLTGGGPASREGGEYLWDKYQGDSEYESKEDYEKKQQKKRNKEANP